jgi:hypothetical protein
VQKFTSDDAMEGALFEEKEKAVQLDLVARRNDNITTTSFPVNALG